MAQPSVPLHAMHLPQADREFVDTLAAIRGGACSPEVLALLTARCSRPLDTSDGILPTMVCANTHPHAPPLLL